MTRTAARRGLLIAALSAAAWAAAGHAAPPSQELRIGGFSFEARGAPDAGGLRIDADEALVRRRRFGAFTVQPFREILMQGVRIRFPADDAGRASTRLDGALGLGPLTRLLMSDLEIDVLRGGRPSLRIGAAQARATADGQRFELHDVVVATSDGLRIAASRARLRGGTRLDVPGAYAWQEHGSGGRGAELSFDIASADTAHLRTLLSGSTE